MNTKLTAGFFSIFAGLCVASIAVPAFADLQISTTTTIDAPGMKSMLAEIPQDKREPLLGDLSPMMTGAPWITTTYLKGNRVRTDMGQTTVVVNAASGKEFTLNNNTHVYSIGAYDPFQSAAGMFTCTITPTSETSTMLGHPIARYTLSMTSSVLPKSPIVGEIWAATDLPTPPAPTYTNGPAADFGAEMLKVHGMPLAFKIIYENTPAGTITVTSYATSIVDQPLSLAQFEIPTGYVSGSTRLATKTPTTGYPLGDGMPLDSTSPVTDSMATGQEDDSASGLGDMQGLQGLLSGLMGSQTTSSDPSGASGMAGMSPQVLSGLLGGLSGGSGAGASAGSVSSLSSLINPQMLQQLQSELSQLTSSDDGE